MITKQGRENYEATDHKKCCVCLLRYLWKAGSVTRQNMSPASLCQGEPEFNGMARVCSPIVLEKVLEITMSVLLATVILNMMCVRHLANTAINPSVPHVSNENTEAQLRWLLQSDSEVAGDSHTRGVESHRLCSLSLCQMLQPWLCFSGTCRCWALLQTFMGILRGWLHR